MNLINKDTDYAVRALCFMARNPDEKISVAEMQPELKVPGQYLRRILQSLARSGILRSFKGKGGGFVLNKTPEQIYLLDVIEVFQGKFDMADCRLRHALCANYKTCSLRRTLKDVEAIALKKLKSVTIASLQ